MRSVIDFYGQLLNKYGGTISFKRICEVEKILAVKGKLPESMKGFYIADGTKRVIVLNELIPYEERRDWAFHELWHALQSPYVSDGVYSNREEARANLFAALCRAPIVREGDTIETLRDRYNISPWLAKIRIEFELKRIGG